MVAQFQVLLRLGQELFAPDLTAMASSMPRRRPQFPDTGGKPVRITAAERRDRTEAVPHVSNPRQTTRCFKMSRDAGCRHPVCPASMKPRLPKR